MLGTRLTYLLLSDSLVLRKVLSAENEQKKKKKT